MMKNSLVSVITVTRNRADLISRCINSILSQTYTNFEYIIVDGASSDDTETVVKSFNDNRIKYIRTDEEQSGYISCYNIALSAAKGEYLCFLDDDDEYLPSKIEKQVCLIRSLPEEYGMVYCWMTYFDAKTGKILRLHNPQLRGDVAKEVVERPVVSGTPTFLIKKDAFFKLGGFLSVNETGINSDWAFAARFCQHYKVDYIPESLINIYINHSHIRMTNAGSYYSDSDKKTIKFHNYFLSTYSAIYDEYPEKGWYHYEGLVSCYIRQSNYKEAWKNYKKLLKAKPSFGNLILPVKIIVKKILVWK